tara:strand:+ start:160 stop:525 length:366 start_codon:yes stop_codon:yes gene_type:complete
MSKKKTSLKNKPFPLRDIALVGLLIFNFYLLNEIAMLKGEMSQHEHQNIWGSEKYASKLHTHTGSDVSLKLKKYNLPLYESLDEQIKKIQSSLDNLSDNQAYIQDDIIQLKGDVRYLRIRR